MRVLIIEDELPAADRLVGLLKDYDASIEVVGVLDSNQSILAWYEVNSAPNLIFSDIELLDGQVFDSLKKVQITTPIIFTTAYEQYALKAFETSGISYLLKPYEQKEVDKAIEKYKSFSTKNGITHEAINSLRNILSNTERQYKTKLSIKIGTGIYLLNINEITSVITQNGIAYAFKTTGKKLPLSGLLSEIMDTLNPNNFFRINRSEIVSAHFIEKIEPYFNDRLAIKIAGVEDKLIVSGARTPAFRKWLEQV